MSYNFVITQQNIFRKQLNWRKITKMRNILQNKRGSFELDQLQSVVITLVVIGIVIGLALIVLGEFISETDDQQAQDGINNTIQAIGDVSGWLSLIVLVLVIGVILAIVFNVLPGARATPTPGMPVDY